MSISLKELLNVIVSKHSIKSAEQFTKLIDNNEAYISEIIEASMSDRDVYFEKNTFDGWYCIEKLNDNYHVYHQERGRVGWLEKTIIGKSRAITEVLLLSHCMHLTNHAMGKSPHTS